ncbi:IPTL-CTERM sorting domain-containing protein [Dokdonella sp. MW10]|uniref:IPTL-CTERM sorting domain-containing protein n=1 Tax=Dokdonella sp. MW10 TaxID=2992926 RepID=UPI003F7F75FC
MLPRTARAVATWVIGCLALAGSVAAQAQSTCAGFIPPSIATPAQLVTAVQQAQSANCPGADTIDLGGNTITFTSASFTDTGESLALPVITTAVTIRNGTITRSSATGFRFLAVTSGGNLVLNNLTLSNGGGAGISDGGAVRVASAALTVVNSRFLDNTAPAYGGGAILATGNSVVAVADSLFQRNQAGGHGGAINTQLSGGALSIDRSHFLGNVAGGFGGAVSKDVTAPLTVRDSLFAGNAAPSGSAIYVNNDADNLTVINTTIAGGRGVAIAAAPSVVTSAIRNSIVWGNQGGSLVGTFATVTHTAAEGFAGATINTGYTAEDFFVNPLVNPTAANTGLNYNPALYDWSLRPFSPAIDAGDSFYALPLDLAGATRRVDDPNVTDAGAGASPRIDMGAYERQTSSCSSFAFPYTLGGATNGVRRLNLRDAVRCANLNGSPDDDIQLGGQTVTFATPFATLTALPPITSSMRIANGALARDTAAGTPAFRLVDITSGGDLSLDGVTLSGGSVPTTSGGAIRNAGSLNATRSVLRENTANQGGALHVTVGGSASLSRSTLSGNLTQANGSAVFNQGSLTLHNSTVATNQAMGSGAVFAAAGDTTLINTTIATNSASSGAAGLVAQSTTLLANTIVANNAPTDCSRTAAPLTFSSGTTNLIGNDHPSQPCGIAWTNYLTGDPGLGALTGSPPYFPIASASSLAANTGDNASVGGATVDQPGNARIQQGTVDLGSVESPFASPVVTLQFAAPTSSAAEAAGIGNVLRVTTSDGQPTRLPTRATVSVTSGTATAADYNLTGTITVPVGTADGALVSIASGITVTNDAIVEANETLGLTLSAPQGAVIGAQATTIHTILNDDTATITVGDVSMSEGNTGTSLMTFTVTVDQAVQGGFSLDYTTTDLFATVADGDYLPASGTLIFSGTAGESLTINVTINGDTKVESNETFRVLFPSALGTVAPGSLIITDTATGTILNDDNAAITIADVSVAEGNAGTTAMTFTATLDNAVQGGFTVNVATANGTATTADNDYVAATGTLSFTGAAGQTRTFTVTINGDTKVEADETFTVSMNTVSNPGVTITDTAIGTILNDDATAVTIADVIQTEGGSFIFTATLGNATGGAFSVDWTLSPGTTDAADYVGGVLPTGGTLTFTGLAGQTRTFVVPVFDDAVVEGTETFTVAMTNFTSAGGFTVTTSDTATGTILDNDTAAVTIANASMAEGDSGTSPMTFTATLDRAVQGGFTVNFATANGSATTADNDYVATTGTLTFTGTAGETQTFNVTINGDTVVEPDETFTVSMNTVSNSGVTITDTAIGTILNDDVTTLTIGDASLVEGDTGETSMIFTVTLADTLPGGTTVGFSTADGTATVADGDYITAAGTLTFAGTAGETQTLAVRINGDTRVEQDETFTVTLGSVSNPNATPGGAATGTILNDDSAAVTIADVNLAEGDTGTSVMTFTATLDAAVQGGFTVAYATADGTATTTDNDYVAASGTLTFAGNAGETQTIAVTINGDQRHEADETFTLAMSSSSNASVDVSDIATGTILNDDAAPAILVTPTGGLVTTEAGGTATFTVVLASAPTADVTIGLSSNDTTEGTVAPASLVFTPANWNTAQTATVTGVDDLVVDGDIAYTIVTAPATSADATYHGIDPADVGVTNEDDDNAGVTVTPTSLDVTEGGAGASYTVVLTSAPTSPVTITATADAQVTATPASLVFTSANWNVAQTVAVDAVDDTLPEGPHTGAITHAASGGGYDTISIASVDVHITDNDGGIVVTPTSGLVTTEAGGTVTFMVVLASAPTADVTIGLSSSDTTEGTVSPTSLVFTATNWNTAQTVTVTGVDDDMVDGDIAYTIVTAPATSSDPAYQGVDADDVAVTNEDDDQASLRIDDASIVEGDTSTTALVFTVTLDGAVEGGVDVAYATADGSATAPADYTATSGTLTFAGTDGETQTISVPILGDTLVEGDETFTLTLSAPQPATVTLARAEATGTILDDDASALLVAAKRIVQVGTPLQPVRYEIVLHNAGSGPQVDAPGSDELVDVLPAELALSSASASGGVVDLAGNTVRWNGALAAGASVTILIEADVVATVPGPISNQAVVHYDSDGDGLNDASGVSNDPDNGPGPTTFVYVLGGPPPVAVPTLDLWSLLGMALLMGGLGAWRRKRQVI